MEVMSWEKLAHMYATLSNNKCICTCKKECIHITDPEIGLSLDLQVPCNGSIDNAESEKCESLIVTVKNGGRILEKYAMLENVRCGEYIRYRKDEKLKIISYYKSDMLHGFSYSLYPSGSLCSLSLYNEGKKEGRSYILFENGVVRSQHIFLQGKLHGVTQEFYSNSHLKTEMMYKEGLLDGKVLLYYENANLARETFFVQGKRCGQDCQWSEDGVLLFAIDYDMGRKVCVHIKDQIAEMYQL